MENGEKGPSSEDLKAFTDRSQEEARQRFAKEKGLPPDATWADITADSGQKKPVATPEEGSVEQTTADDKVTISTEIISAAFGNPRVLRLFKDDTDRHSDATRALENTFGGEEEKSVNLQDVTRKIDSLDLTDRQKEALKASIAEVGRK